MNSKVSLLLLSVAAMAGSSLNAADLTGTVRSSSGTSAEVVLTGDLVPAAGDKATVFFLIPGGSDEVVVASGSVDSVGAETVKLRLKDVSGTVAKDQQVRIISASPQKRAAMPANPRVIPTNPTNPVNPNDHPPGNPGNPPPGDGEDGDETITLTIPGKHPGDPDRTITIPAGKDGKNPPPITIPLPSDEDHAAALRPLSGNKAVPIVPIPGKTSVSASTPTEHFNLGYALFTAGKPAEAIASFTKAIELEPRYATAYYFRARASIDTKDNDTIVADATKAIDLNYVKQDDAFCVRGTGWAGKGDFKKALADHSAAIALNPKHALAWNNRANDRLQSGDTKGAIADCDQSIALDPKSALPWYNRGHAWFRLDNKDKAVADWTKAVLLEPSFKRELEPLIQRCGGALPSDTGIPDEETVKELMRRFVPPGAESSDTIRRK